jgi:hypothetical protein
VGVAVATLLGMIGVCAYFFLDVPCVRVRSYADYKGAVLGLLAPKPKEVKKKAGEAAQKVEQVVSEAKSQAKEGASEVRKRTGKGKAPAE